MSGIKTVAEIIKIARQTANTPEEMSILQSLLLLGQDRVPNTKKLEEIYAVEKTMADCLVFLGEDGKFVFKAPPATIAGDPSSSKLKEKVDTKTMPELIQPEVPFNPEMVKELIKGKSLSIDVAKIQEVLSNYMKDLPKTIETYGPGSVKVKIFKGVVLNIPCMLSAGTKILDAILYMAYHDSNEHLFIFDVEELAPQMIRGNVLNEEINNGHKAIKAAFCVVWNQGSLPTKSSDQRNLSKFIKEMIFRKKDLTSNELCDYLSSADPVFFPAVVFLNVPLDYLPVEVASRCKMSVAGNKAVRYAQVASKFDKMVLPNPSADPASVASYLVAKAKLDKANLIMAKLCAVASDHEKQKLMHPLSPSRTTRKNFSLQLTCAIMYSLSHQGRVAFRDKINKENIAAFKRDENVYGALTLMQVPYFPVLENSEADFSELSVEAVNSAYQLSA